MIGVIARARWRATVNAVRKTDRGRRRFILGLVVFLVLFVTLGVPLFIGIAAFFRYAMRVDPGAVAQYPPLIFTAVTLFTLVGNFVATLSALYFSPTLPLLLAAPVPTRTVFTVALIEGSLATPFVLIAALLVLTAYGIGVGAEPAYYLVCVIGMVAVSVLVAALTQMLVVGVLRIVPARRVREAVSLLGAIVSVVGYGLWYASRTGGRSSARAANGFQTLADRTRPLAHWTPPGWAGSAANAAQMGNAIATLGWLLLLSAVAGGIIACAYALFHRAFLVGWSGTREAVPRRRVTRTAAPLGGIGSAWSPPIQAIARKEIRTLVRDTKRLSIAVRSVGFTFIYLFLFIFRGTLPGGTLPVGASYWLRLLLLVSVLLIGLSSGISGYTFGLEGPQFGLYRLAPLSAATLMLAKWLAGVCLVLPIGIVIALGAGIWLHGGPIGIALTPLVALWYALGLVTIRVAAAAISPRFDAPQPNRSTGQVGVLAGMLVSGLFVIGSFCMWAGIALPTIPASTTALRAVRDYSWIVALAALIGAALALGSAGIIWSTAQRRLARLLAPQAE